MIRKKAPLLIWKCFQLYKETCRGHFQEKLSLQKQASAEVNNNNTKNKVAVKTSTGIDLDKVAPVDKISSEGSPTRPQNRVLTKCKSNDVNLAPKPKAELSGVGEMNFDQNYPKISCIF